MIRPKVQVRTFCGFDIFVDEKPVHFRRSKSKEVLAYLVDRQGMTVTRGDAFSVIFEDEEYDRSKQKQFDVILRSLRDTLREYDIESIYEVEHGTLRIVPEKIDCDLYRFFDGDEKTINSYRGEYMTSYSWAMMTEAYLDQKAMMNV